MLYVLAVRWSEYTAAVVVAGTAADVLISG